MELVRFPSAPPPHNITLYIYKRICECFFTCVRGYASGQRGWTVNSVEKSFMGSNPIPLIAVGLIFAEVFYVLCKFFVKRWKLTRF